MNRVGIAVVGAGAIGCKHAEALVRSKTARLTAIVDADPGTAGLARSLGVPYLAGLDVLPAETEGVIIATPTRLHVDQALICLSRSLPALVEKPIAATSQDAARLVAAAADTGVPVLIGHHRRHNPRIAAARAAIEAGELGQVISAQAMVLLCKPDAYFWPEWRRQPGAGPILTNLVHEVDTLRYLLGEVVEVLSLTSNSVRRFEIEDSAAAVLRFASGALATLTVSDCAAAPWSWELTAKENPDYPATGQSCLMIAGTKASLELPTLRFWRHAGQPSWFTPMTCDLRDIADEDPLSRQLDHFADVIRGKRSPLVSAEDAARTLAVVEAIANGHFARAA